MKTTISLLLLTCISFYACQSAPELPVSEYHKDLALAAETGQEANDLIGGLYFGMNRATFYDYCAKQEKLGRMREGMDRMVRVYVDSSAIAGTTVLEFFPAFEKEGKIDHLNGRIYSLSWAPWNQEYDAINLLPKAADYLIEQLGGNPFKGYDLLNDNTLVKVDGNRVVYLYPHKFAKERIVFSIHNQESMPKDFLARQGFLKENEQ